MDGGIASFFTFIAIFVPIIITLYQILQFNRFMFLKLVYPTLCGQCVAVLCFLLTYDTNVLTWFDRRLNDIHVIVSCVLMVVFLCLSSLFFELHKIVVLIIAVVACVLVILLSVLNKTRKQLYRIILFVGSLSIIVYCVYHMLCIKFDLNRVEDQCSESLVDAVIHSPVVKQASDIMPTQLFLRFGLWSLVVMTMMMNGV